MDTHIRLVVTRDRLVGGRNDHKESKFVKKITKQQKPEAQSYAFTINVSYKVSHQLRNSLCFIPHLFLHVVHLSH